MQSDLLLLKRMLLTIVTFTGIALTSQGQIPLTIDKAMEIAQENSPSLRRSYMNLERYKQNLLAHAHRHCYRTGSRFLSGRRGVGRGNYPIGEKES